DLECVSILLEAGADLEGENDNSPLRHSATREIAMHLLGAGCDPAHANHRLILGLPDAVESDSVEADWTDGVTPADFGRGRARRFGTKNPEQMDDPFWVAMIQAGVSGYEARRRFQSAIDVDNGPVWCAKRFGQSLTHLLDGRAIQIGGEHEDFYDPDFC